MKPPLTQKTVILVNGIPASGKSSLARLISEHFSLPYLILDQFKEPFMAIYARLSREQNRKLGWAAYEALWQTVRLAPAECTYVIDAWFGFQSKETLVGYLQQAGVTQVLEVWNQISGPLACQRYQKRISQRPKGHPGEEYLPELNTLAQTARPMAIGPVFSFKQGSHCGYGPLFLWLQQQLYPAVEPASPV
ncbi:MAG: hypothetical protein CENE_01633 [Candidatus Celerinatantimonas neptuna]|nr:MAG: hypothetical protein CENE_01633 [Candidatus Celerinatantimonas neptuna]